MDDKHEVIRERAYAIWREEGEPHGRDADHWQRAEQEVSSAASGSAATPPPKAPRKRAPKKA